MSCREFSPTLSLLGFSIVSLRQVADCADVDQARLASPVVVSIKPAIVIYPSVDQATSNVFTFTSITVTCCCTRHIA
jgi:hypothetical protein